jgi:hypothetical protein
MCQRCNESMPGAVSPPRRPANVRMTGGFDGAPHPGGRGATRPAMSRVKHGATFGNFFFLKSFCSFFLSGSSSEFQKNVFRRGEQSVAPPAIRAWPRTCARAQHPLTPTVTARKRARPIYQTGRARPKGASGRAPFQISSGELSVGWLGEKSLRVFSRRS